MAKIDLKFLDCESLDGDYIRVEKDNETNHIITISGCDNDGDFIIYLDKSTAIKFAKTLRTEIAKIQD